jgi:hypothetical protein
VRIFRQKSEEDDDAPIPGKVLTQSAPPRPARFCGARAVGDFVILDWDTAYGTVGWAHYLNGSGHRR